MHIISNKYVREAPKNEQGEKKLFLPNITTHYKLFQETGELMHMRNGRSDKKFQGALWLPPHSLCNSFPLSVDGTCEHDGMSLQD